jgi:hypothetical protein
MADGRRSSARTAAAATGRGVEIGALRLSVPGRDAAFGQRLATRVGQTLAERCPTRLAGGELGLIQLRVQAGDLSEIGLSDTIANAVLAALGRI